MTDPFAHHPELRERILPADQNFMRNTPLEELDRMSAELGTPPGWRLPDDLREADRLKTLAGRMDQDLWVFAYGSLMWDPGIHFAEVRRGHLKGYSRCFDMVENLGGRGTADRPGAVATLDRGTGCDGLVFRISAQILDRETDVLWQRERIAPGYLPVFRDVAIDDGQVEALCFVSDHAAAIIHPGLSRQQIVRHIALGEGVLGSSLDYVRNLNAQLALLGLADPDLPALLDEAEALAAQHASD